MVEPHDVLIIGGGPGGSTAATLLARRGRRVLLLEKDRFPRFHVGESLLPYNQRVFEELGVLAKLEAAGFTVKHGAQFHAANGQHAAHFVFSKGYYTRETRSFQVERSRFDDLLLRHAEESGAEVREGWVVRKFERCEAGVRLSATDGEGVQHDLEGRFLIDASGRGNMTANQAGLREMHPRHRKLAIYGHFRGVERDLGDAGGDTVIVRLPRQWFWLIPIGLDRVSVGCVVDKDEFAAEGRSPGEVFDALVKSSVLMQRKLRQAEPVRSLEMTTDFSYRNRKIAEPRLLRVGDAAGFMDPIFSAGVYLAMLTGSMAAGIAGEAVQRGDDGGAALAGYERRVRRSLQTYWRMVEAFYRQPFMELFFSPNERFHLASAVNAVLAGELEGGWRLAWRLKLFFLLVRLQARFPLVPRVKLES